MTTKSPTAALFAAALGIASTFSWAQALKPCALLTSAEVKSVATSPPGEGVAEFLAPTASHTCVYKWAARDFSPSLVVTASDASKMYPGMSAEMLKMGLLAGKDMTAIPGIGDAAGYKSDSPTAVLAIALLKGKVLTVTYRGTDAVAKKGQVVGLLKSAASRLP